jgi:hypothetical protein
MGHRHECPPTVHPTRYTHKLSTNGWGWKFMVWFGHSDPGIQLRAMHTPQKRQSLNFKKRGNQLPKR